MKSISISILLLAACQVCAAFQQSRPSLGLAFTRTRSTTPQSTTSSSQLHAITSETISDVGYATSVQKPLGIVFGENPDPYFGLVVDDVAEGLNGGKAGLRVRDQLLAINGQVVVGKDFDTIMGILQSAPARLDLKMYRGSADSLYTILGNRMDENESFSEEEEEEKTVMDDDYWNDAVRIEVKERKPLSAGDVFKAFGKLGSMLTEGEKPAAAADGGTQEKKKSGGFFGMGAESIQLDGNDANGLK
jgi:hypothetical protein